MQTKRLTNPRFRGRLVALTVLLGSMAVAVAAGFTSTAASAASSVHATAAPGSPRVPPGPLPPRMLRGGHLKLSGGYAGVLALSPSAPLSATAGPWTLVSSPNLTSNDYLNAVTCVASDDCWAVGAATNSGITHTLIEQNTGSGWGVVQSPGISGFSSWLNGISCVTSDDCWAVGVGFGAIFGYGGGPYHVLIEHYNGTSWSEVAGPGMGLYGGEMFDVSCLSGDVCWAVGDFYNGTNWQVIGMEDNVFFPGGGPNNWGEVSIPSGPGDSGLFYVTCVSASDCWAVGNSSLTSVSGNPYQTLIEQWNGSTWSIVSSPNVGTHIYNVLGAITCTSATNCWANGVYANSHGYFQTLIEQYNGTAWSIVSSPNQGTADILNGLACASATVCWSVGEYFPTSSNIPDQTLAEQYNGTSWNIVASPNTSSSVDNQLFGMTCDGTVNCWAVGDSVPSINTTTLACIVCRTLVEQSVQANAPPVITSLTPAAGPVGGGQVVTVNTSLTTWAR